MEGWAFWYSVSDLSLPIRAQLSSLVFYKSLRRKNNKTDDKTEYDGDVRTNSDKCGSRESTETSTKETMVLQSRQAVVNLVGVDTDRISYFFQLQFLIVNGVFKLLISSAFLVWLIGWIPFSAGVLAWTLIFPISAWSSSLLLTQSASLMELRDAKLSKINEALRGIRQIKFSALESQWERRILALRSMELRALWRYFVADSALFGCGVMGPILLAVTSLVTYVLINNQLLPSVAFVSIALLSTLESTLGTLPELITLGIDTLVSINRLDTYLKGSEMENTLTRGPTVGFKEATISWHVDFNATEEGTFTLDNLNLAFPTGQLSVISGKTGSGKSLLVSAILGEANLLKGSILMPETSHPSGLGTAHSQDWIVRGRLAYVSQNPWLENNSLRDNILFGLPFIRERYDKVINMCALRQDLELLTDSDSTELGADGVNLSGGQKWRITLARAIYSRAEILILEDIFCAVDALVGRWILDKCLVGELCESRTRILVTHNLGLVLPKAKYVVELEEGTVRYSGSPQHDIRLPDPQQGPAWKDITDATQSRSTLEDGLVMSYAENTKASRSSPMTSQPKPARKFVQDETHKKGNVLKRVYITYLKSSGGLLLWGLCAIVFVTYQVGILGKLRRSQ